MEKEYSQTPGARYRRKRYRADPAAVNKAKRLWLAKNPDHKRDPKKAVEATTRWRQRNLEKARARRRIYEIKTRYRISLDEYEQIVQWQNGRCAICREIPVSLVFHVDHNHVTGATRGLLCGTCNILLGNAKESQEVLYAAIEYLHQHATLKVA